MRTVLLRRSRGICLPAILLCIFLSGYSRCRAECGVAVFSQSGQAAPGQAAGAPTGNRDQNRRRQPPSRPHLAEWLRQHQNMSLKQQERALRNEPGFNRLPLERQQRLLSRLQQVNAMPPLQRERTLERMEALEKLSPQQREQVHSAMQEVGRLPAQRRQLMRKAFHDLSRLPQERRRAVLDSPQFKGQFSDRERQMLRTLMSVQPYRPVNRPDVEYGGK